MKRLVFIVEGDTEIILIEKLIVPYLISKGFNNVMHVQTIITNRKQHKKGGVSTYGKFKNEVVRTLAQGDVIVTTLIDFFKLPTDFPNYTEDSTRIEQIEKGISDDISSPDFLSYVQRHELEALMFSAIDGFELVVDDDGKLNQLKKIMTDYPNPEDINNSPQTAPSKRLFDVFGYDKTGDGSLIFEMLDVETIMDKCPRFKEWIEKLVEKLEANRE